MKCNFKVKRFFLYKSTNKLDMLMEAWKPKNMKSQRNLKFVNINKTKACGYLKLPSKEHHMHVEHEVSYI
jgi:hypothetical protein